MINLPDTILATMRSAAESLMTDTCTLAVKVDAVGEMGELLPGVWSVVASGVQCRMITQSSQTAMSNEPEETAGRETLTEVYRLIVPYDTALAVDQRITLDSDSSVYQIVDLITGRTSKVDNQAMAVRIVG